MKRITAIALLALAGAIGTGRALAQDHEVRATVPFAFTVGTKTLPAGTYSINRVINSAIAIQNRDSWDSRDSAMSTASQDTNESAKNVLVFDKYAGHYFLRGILCESAGMNVSLPRSKSESHARELEAKNPTDGGQVLLALK